MKRPKPEPAYGLHLRASSGSMPWGPNSSSSSSFKDPNKSFDDFGKYMNEKKKKLRLQYQKEASNEGIGLLTETHGSSPSDNVENFDNNTNMFTVASENNISKLFHGISIFVDGFTIPSHQELRSLMKKHGGNFENYFSRQLVTHIICSTLPDSKIRVHRSFSRGLPIVKPSWITDSINCGKVLPISPYFHERIVREHPNQCTISDVLNHKKKDPRKSLEDTERVLKEENPHDFSEDLPLQELIKDPTLEKPIDFQQGEKKNDDSEQLFPTEYDDSSTDRTIDPETDGSFDLDPSVSKGGGVSENLRMHCTLGDSNFVQNYFKNSRLHFIGTWRNRYQNRFKSKDAEPQQEKHLNRCDSSSSSPNRIIMHIDMDCFFVSVVVRDRPHLAGKPIAVCSSEKVNGTAEISSSNYAARKFGIKSGMFIGDAKLLCPELEVVPYDFEGYEEVADQLYDILHKYCRKVQAISCDEAFLDFTGTENPETLASTIRKEIFDMTRCTASVGIAENLLLARLATRKAKPDGQYRIVTEEVEKFLSSLPIEDLPGVGWSLQEKLQAQAIYNCNHLRSVSKESLQREFGSKTGDMLWGYARGIDHREVQDYQERKSIGAEVNWGVRFETTNDVDHFLTTLCSEVSMRLQNAAVCGRTFTLKIKKRKEGAGEPQKFMGCGICDNFSKSVTIASATNNADMLLRVSKQMFSSFHLDVREIRGMGLQATKLVPSPRNMDDPTQQRQKLLESCMPFVSKEKHNNNVPKLDHTAPVTHKPKNGSTSWGMEKEKAGMKGLGKVVKGPFRTLDQKIQQKNIQQPKITSRNHNLPDVSEVDPAVLAELPEEILAEINDAYKGALKHQIKESEDEIIKQSSKDVDDKEKPGVLKVCGERGTITRPTFTSPKEASTSSLAQSCRKFSEMSCCGQAMPSSLSEIDMATLHELPLRIQEDIMKTLSGSLPIDSDKEACKRTDSEYTDLGEEFSQKNLDSLWCGSPPRWVSLFQGLSGVGSEILHHLSKDFLKYHAQPFSSVFRHVMCQHHIDREDEFLYNCFLALLKQYLQQRVSTDLEEIYSVARIVNRLTDRAQIWGKLWRELATCIQAATTECYGGLLCIAQ